MKKLESEKLIKALSISVKWLIFIFSFLAWYPHKFITSWQHLVLPNDFTAFVFLLYYLFITEAFINLFYAQHIKDSPELEKYKLNTIKFWILTVSGHILGFLTWKVFAPGGLGL